MNDKPKETAESIPHPCIRHCCLDEEDVCMGCFRTLEEILHWNEATDGEKRSILKETKIRKQAR
ncbi:DUF1289 domain-containing protein [Vibrio mexicanus]|uniref:DUF1289 domain-containing protein n=1 Tax=Vibrio mexicanus TaxID=1004326 RepID=UPI00063CBFAD|nr:DUF1289 domain-containing protein [Vibrio mexicanus]